MAAHRRGANGPVVSMCVFVSVCVLLPMGMKSQALKKESIALVAD